MITEDRSYQAICALSSLLGPSPVSSFTSFFDSDNEQSVMLVLEKLLKENILTKTGSLICPPKEKTDASLLFNLKDSSEVSAECLNREYIRAVENLTISRTASLRDSSLYHFLNSDKLKSVFTSPDEDLFLHVRSFLKSSNVFIQANKNIILNKIAERAVLSLDRLSLCASVMKNVCSEDFSAFLGSITCFFKTWSTDRAGLDRVVRIYLIKHNCKTEVCRIISLLLELRILLLSEDGLYNLNRSYLEPESEGSVICDSDFSVLLTASPNPESRIHVFCNIQHCDRSTLYTFDKASFFRGLDEGLTKDDMLKALSYPPFSQIVSGWEEEYNRIRIYKGTVICCSEEISLLITGIPEISSSIIRKISENVFLMSDENYGIWSSRLAEILDMENLPKVTAEEAQNPEGPVLSIVTVADGDLETVENRNSRRVSRISENPESLEEAFKGIPGQSKSGMDYRGKLALLKEAVKKASSCVLLMELLDERTVVAKPIELKKSGEVDYLLFRNLFTSEEEIIKAGTIYSIKLVELQVLQ